MASGVTPRRRPITTLRKSPLLTSSEQDSGLTRLRLWKYPWRIAALIVQRARRDNVISCKIEGNSARSLLAPGPNRDTNTRPQPAASAMAISARGEVARPAILSRKKRRRGSRQTIMKGPRDFLKAKGPPPVSGRSINTLVSHRLNVLTRTDRGFVRARRYSRSVIITTSKSGRRRSARSAWLAIKREIHFHDHECIHRLEASAREPCENGERSLGKSPQNIW